MNKNIKISLFVLLTGLLFFILHHSFSKKEISFFAKHDNIIAMVDDYKITLEDYLSQKAKYTPFYSDNTPVDKKAIMETLINDIVLLKEAEKLKLNQDKTFLREIEYFWRQSLIEGLLKKKNSEIKNQIKISEEEIKEVYHSLKKEYHARIIQLSVQKSELKTEIDKIDEAYLNAHLNYVHYDSKFNWVDLKSLEPQLRHQLLKMDIPLNKWVSLEDKTVCYLLYFDNVRERDLDKFENMQSEIESFLQEDKEREALDDWLEAIGQKAKIVINTDLYSKI